MRKTIGAVLTLALVLVLAAPSIVAAGQALFEPDQKLSKGYFGSLTYQFIRDKIPGGKAVLEQCSGENPYGDLGDESAFKQTAVACLNEWGYFDRVKGHDRAGAPVLSGDGDSGAGSTEKPSLGEVAPGKHGDWSLEQNDDGYWVALTTKPHVRYPTLYTDGLVVRCGHSDELEFYAAFDGFSGSSFKVQVTFHPNGDKTEYETWGESVSEDAVFAPDAERFARLIRSNHDAVSVAVSVQSYHSSGSRFEIDDAGNTFSMKGAAKTVRGLMERCGR